LAAVTAGNFTLLQAILEDIIERSSTAWFIFMACYHVNVIVMATWFLIAAPEVDIPWKSSKSSKSSASKGASMNSMNSAKDDPESVVQATESTKGS
jgi:hypothetical protein